MKKSDPIQKIRTLLEKKSVRKKEGMFVVEGPHLIEEAIKANRNIDYVVHTQNFPIIQKLKDITKTGLAASHAARKRRKKGKDYNSRSTSNRWSPTP